MSTMAQSDVAGQRFNALVAMSPSGRNRAGHPLWRCSCDCGAHSEVSIYKLLSGHTTSCGCRQRSVRRRHGDTDGRKPTPEFRAWKAMVQRCTNPNFPKFATWGGRGITVCARWRDYAAFLADMGRRPSPGHSLDRIDPDGHYEPGNCRWVTKDIQQHNLRPRTNTGYLGVCMPAKGNRFLWRIKRGGTVLHGSALTLEEAITAHAAARAQLYGDIA